MRLIDADNIPWEECYVPDGDIQWEYKKALSVTKEDVDKMSTIDAKPIVHAEWIRGIKDEPDSDHYCSHCMSETSAIRARHYIFCPFCGATMDLERQGTDE